MPAPGRRRRPAELTEHIAIIDLMNLADALLLPQDDWRWRGAEEPAVGSPTTICSDWRATERVLARIADFTPQPMKA